MSPNRRFRSLQAAAAATVDQNFGATSPSERVPIDRQMAESITSDNECTEPSANAAFTEPA